MFARLKNFKNLDLIFNSISDMVFLIEISEDGSFRYVTANQVAINLLQFPIGFEGKSIEEIMPSFSAEVITARYQEAIVSKKVVMYEEKIEFPIMDELDKTRNGWVESKVTPVLSDDGEVEYLITVTREITERKNYEKELNQLKEQFELIYNHAADPVFTFDETGKYITVNPSYTKLFGWTKEELLNDPAISILPTNNKQEFEAILERLKQGEVIENHYAERKTKNGSLIHILSSYTPIMEDGKMSHGIAVYKDISNIDQLRNKLQESERKYRIIVENSNDLIRIINKLGQIEYASPSHLRILGLESKFFIGKSILSFVHREDMVKVNNYIEKLFETGRVAEIEYRRLNKNGEIIWVHSKGAAVLNGLGEVEQLVLISRVISDLKERETELRTMALYDELTSLANRTLFNENLDVALNRTKRSGKMTALLILDCDNFKKINDSYGHDVGDEVIKEFANRIQTSVGTLGTVSRMGGDEFQVVLPELRETNEAIAVCQSIISKMKEPMETGLKKITVSASIGVSYYKGVGKTKEELVKEADVALYQSKDQGKSTYSEYRETENKWKKNKLFSRFFDKERKS
ncbi:diguanylate cyclase domain-containing protein [Radiobacillus sp. PE A8.2]|uniref:diguanylate cyclase domain-containing protein n=1 Tax=Radiobacillus sp. PE A8.2 TaxID=3380349 RepID=UPI00388E22FE